MNNRIPLNITAHGSNIIISIIICSINPERCKRTLLDISKNIGIEYETIVFDNREYNWGICKVYNYCAQNAVSPYLCFMHEDAYVDTKNWGKIIVDFIEKTPDCGVIGISGGLEAKKNFCFLWSGERIMNIYDGYLGENSEYIKFNFKYHNYINPKNKIYAQVLCVDGVFMSVKKNVWSEIQFDEKLYTGFHFYDNDFSFAVAQNYKNYVLLNIDIFHDSPGSINNEYIENMFVFQNKWHNKLPLYLENNVIKKSRLKIMHSELKGMVEMYKICREKKIKLKKYNDQITKINGKFILPVFYVYYYIKSISKIIIFILQKI